MFALGLHFRRENEKRAAQQAAAAKNRNSISTTTVRIQNQRTNGQQLKVSNNRPKTTMSTTPRPTNTDVAAAPTSNLPSRSISAPGPVVPPPEIAMAVGGFSKRSGSSTRNRNSTNNEQQQTQNYLDVTNSKSGSKSPQSHQHGASPRVFIAHQFLQPTGLVEMSTTDSVRVIDAKKTK